MAEDFDLGPPSSPPLTMAEALPAKQNKTKQWMRLAMIMSAAAKGGPGAIEGVLQGMQRSDLLQHNQENDQFQQRRQVQNDALLRQREAENTQYHNATLADRELARKQDFLTKFQGGIDGLDSQEAVDAYVRLHQGQSQAFGVDPAQLGSYAAAAMPPSKLQKKAAESYVGKLKATYGNDWMEKASQFGKHVVKGEELTLDQVLARAELPGVAAPTPKPNAVNPGSFEEYVNLPPEMQALREQQRKKFNQSDDRPRVGPDPQLADINRQLAQARLDNLTAAKNTTALPPRIQRSVEQQARGFDAQQITKNTQKMAEAVSFANGLDPKTQNPADDQALIYAFAKAMDPDSVVREGEYATVQHYAQEWAANFGFNAQRIFSNVAFLTPKARANMKSAIQSRYGAARKQYDNVRKSYAQRINKMTGSDDGDTYLIDYAGAFPETGAAGATPAAGGAPPPNPYRR